MVLTLTSDTTGKHRENPIILSTPTTFSALLVSIQILSGPLFPTVSSQRRGGPLPGQVQSQLLTYATTEKSHPPRSSKYSPLSKGGGEEIEDSKAHEVTKNETEVIQVQCAKSEHNKGAKASSAPPHRLPGSSPTTSTLSQEFGANLQS